ncbi:MAG TPA: PadR family transcriptional regulator, partial [Phycisphaerae bacterium]|nr:PadR family transcriptional regulator [Phycisphaerae bacterium]
LSAAEELATTESAVYPILARLARDGLLKVRAAPSPTGPPRRYYRLTALGKARLREMENYWYGMAEAVNNLLREKMK